MNERSPIRPGLVPADDHAGQVCLLLHQSGTLSGREQRHGLDGRHHHRRLQEHHANSAVDRESSAGQTRTILVTTTRT
jgi:hypothetical protein